MDAKDGDIIRIHTAGNYINDEVIWKQDNIVLIGAGGRPKIHSDRKIPNGKALWVTKGDDIRIKNIEFSGARVSDKNGAGIRAEGTNLTIENCYFNNNENGILAGKNSASTIKIVDSEFSNNGHGDGFTHNVYIGAIKHLIFRGNFSYHARVGHSLKSRAARNTILYNRFLDGVDGTASYLIDLPNGGYSIVMGNLVQQGPKAENWALLAYGMEGLTKSNKNQLYVSFNTFVNNRHSGVFLNVSDGTQGIAANNIFAGNGKISNGELVLERNFATKGFAIFKDPSIFDYHLREGSPPIDQALVVETDEGEPLLPKYQMELRGLVPRQKFGDAFDYGAFEYWIY